MKKLFAISILVLIIIAISIGCTSSSSGSKSSFEISPQLKRLDSLMQSRPDSALMILLSLDKACLLPTGCDDLASCTAQACVGALLLSEAPYKTDNPQFKRNELQDAIKRKQNTCIIPRHFGSRTSIL